MKTRIVFASLVLSASVAASTPRDYANQWPLAADTEGAYTIALDEGIYRQIARADLADLAAFNADGEELAFGPLPPAYDAPTRKWHDAVWFALPSQEPGEQNAGDLQLHVTRNSEGNLALDASLLSAAQTVAKSGTANVLIDVRAKDRLIEAISFDFAAGAPDFSARVTVEASDDLQHWRGLTTDAPIASFRQHGQALLRRLVELPEQPTTYLRVHSSVPLPLLDVHQLLRDPGTEPARAALDAGFVRRDGNAFIYRLPARIEVERLSIALADDNAVMHFTVSARDEGETVWRELGDYTAFRLRSAGIALDSEPVEVGATRLREWRIAPDGILAKTPQLRFGYRPENWIVLTHGRAPYTLVAGSARARRGEFAIGALIAQLRGRYGEQWRPQAIGHAPMQTSGGEAALHGWDASEKRTWLLWGVLVLGAGVVIWMVIGLLRSPTKPQS